MTNENETEFGHNVGEGILVAQGVDAGEARKSAELAVQ